MLISQPQASSIASGFCHMRHLHYELIIIMTVSGESNLPMLDLLVNCFYTVFHVALHRSLQLAPALWLVKAEGVGVMGWVQKFWQWTDGDHGIFGGQQHGLPQLMIPAAK